MRIRGFFLASILLGTMVWKPSGVQQLELSVVERGILREMNIARCQPHEMAAQLRSQRRFYQGLKLHITDSVLIRTEEGWPAVAEAILFLENTKPVGRLKLLPGLCNSARAHVRDQGESGKVGHVGSNGSTPGIRINQYGEWGGKSGEIIYYGDQAAEHIVSSLVIDDGVPDRGHRLQIFDPSFHVAGVACGPHLTYGSVCVVDLAGEFHGKKN